MNSIKSMLGLAIAGVAAITLISAAFVVDEAEQAIIVQFG